VNFKIALAPLVRSLRLDAEARRRLLVDVADQACESVLAHNRGQALSISLDEIRSRRDPETYADAIAALCEHAGLAPSELELPDAEALRARSAAGIGLTRPELGVILGLAKLHGRSALLEGDFVEARDLRSLYLSYFPARFRDELSDALDSHPLRREITSLCVVNRLVDAGGAALFTSLHDEIGADASTAAAALLVAEEVIRVPLARARIINESTGSRSGTYDALVELDEGVRMVAHFLVKTGLAGLDADRIKRWRSELDQLFAALGGFLLPLELQHLGERRDRLLEQGLPEELADRLASLPLADRGLNILRVVEATGAPIVETAHVYTRLSEEAGFSWMYERLGFSRRGSLWDRMVVIDLRQGLLDLQRTITEWVLAGKPADADAALDAFLADRAAEIRRIHDLQERVPATDTPSALSVIASRLHGLRPSAARPGS
jgi:glutamate dehydrogenase